MAPAVVAGFDDLAVMGETVEECGSPFGVTKDRGSFTESKLGSDNDRSAFIEAADEIEQQLPACLGKGQIAQSSSTMKLRRAKESARRPCLPPRASASSRLTRSTTL